MNRFILRVTHFYLAVLAVGTVWLCMPELKAADIASPTCGAVSASPQIILAAEVSTCLDGISKHVQRQLLAGAQSFAPSPKPASKLSGFKMRPFHFGGTANMHIELDDDWEPTIPKEDQLPTPVVESWLTPHSFSFIEVFHSPQSPPPERLVFHC